MRLLARIGVLFFFSTLWFGIVAILLVLRIVIMSSMLAVRGEEIDGVA